MKAKRTVILGSAALLAVLGASFYSLMSGSRPAALEGEGKEAHVSGRPAGQAGEASTGSNVSEQRAPAGSGSGDQTPGWGQRTGGEAGRSRFAAVPVTGGETISSFLPASAPGGAIPEQISALSPAGTAASALPAATAMPPATGKARGPQRRGPGYAPGPINMPPAMRAALSQAGGESSSARDGTMAGAGRASAVGTTGTVTGEEARPDTTVTQVGNLVAPTPAPTVQATPIEGTEATPRRRQGRAVPTVEMQRWRAQLGWEAFQEWSVDQARKAQE